MTPLKIIGWLNMEKPKYLHAMSAVMEIIKNNTKRVMLWLLRFRKYSRYIGKINQKLPLHETFILLYIILI